MRAVVVLIAFGLVVSGCMSARICDQYAAADDQVTCKLRVSERNQNVAVGAGAFLIGVAAVAAAVSK